MNAEEVKKIVRIELAVLKYDMPDIVTEAVTKVLEKIRSDEVARRRERSW